MTHRTHRNRRQSILSIVAMGGILIGNPIGAEEGPWTVSQNESALLQEERPTPEPLRPVVESVAFPGIQMPEILGMAIQNNPDLKVLQAKVNASQMKWLAEGLLPNPEVTGGVKSVPGDSDGPILGISQEIPINGELRMQRESARLDYRAMEAESLRETQEILHNVQRQTVEVLAAKASRYVEAENLRITAESFGLVSNRFDSGLVSELPLSLARAEKGTAENSARLAEKEVAIQREKLAVLLGVTETQLPEIGGSLETPLLPPNLQPEVSDRKDLRAKDLELRSAQADIEAARRSRIPNPVFGYEREEAGSEVENFFTLGLEIPILNSGRPEVRKKHADYEVARTERDSLEKTIESEKSLAKRELQERNEAVHRYDSEILPAIRDSLTAAGASFKSGKTDLSLLLQTQSRLVGVRREAVQAKKALRLAELNYLLALGLPPTTTQGNR